MRVPPQSLGIVHCIGIGGIGMSGIAEILHTLGYKVRGSDLSENANIQRLRALGIPVFNQHLPENLEGSSVVVFSSDIKPDNVELKAARSLKLPCVRRAEMLAEIMRLRPSIAVAGTHGKTTTTSLGAWILEVGGLDPTVVSGGIINAYGTNARLGKGDWTIVEADESDGTFVKLPATIAIATNVDPEHLEHYGSYEALKNAFVHYLENIPFYGLAIVCGDHPVTKELAKRITDRRLITYGLEENVDIKAENLRFTPQGTSFDLRMGSHFKTIIPKAPSGVQKDFFLPMFGSHNVTNALAIIACALELGINLNKIKEGLKTFGGVKRRFTYIGAANGMDFIDDYAHHPAEIAATLRAARQVAQKNVIAVVQPHRYSRVAALFDDFTTCFRDADHVVLAPIYSAREEPIPSITHERLAHALQAKMPTGCIHQVAGEEDLPSLLARLGSAGDLCLFMGAGDITAWCPRIVEELSQTSFSVLKKEEFGQEDLWFQKKQQEAHG